MHADERLRRTGSRPVGLLDRELLGTARRTQPDDAHHAAAVVDGRGLTLAEHEERDQARRELLAGVARHGVQRARRLVERVARLEHDRLAVVDPEDHAAVDHVHVRAGRVPVSAAREPARLVVDADGVDDEPVARREVEHVGDALAGVGVGHRGLLKSVSDRPYVREPPTAIPVDERVITNRAA